LIVIIIYLIEFYVFLQSLVNQHYIDPHKSTCIPKTQRDAIRFLMRPNKSQIAAKQKSVWSDSLCNCSAQLSHTCNKIDVTKYL